MRTYPIDANRMNTISTGSCKPVIAWVQGPDGSRKPDPNGAQDRDGDTGLPLWSVEVIVPSDEGDDRDRTSVTEVQIAAKDKPDAGSFGEVLTFEGLLMTPGYVNRTTKQLSAPRWSASGIRRQGNVQAQPKAA